MKRKLTKSEINGILMEVYGMVEKNYNDSRAQIERELDEVAPERKETIQAAVEKWMQENIYGKKSKNLDKIFLEHVKALAAKGKKAFLPRNGKAITKHGLGDQSPEQLATEYELSLVMDDGRLYKICIQNSSVFLIFFSCLENLKIIS